MSNLPACIERAERARLFPILAETSKEGRTLSIFLATLAAVREFRTSFLNSMGLRVGTTAKLRTFTEVVFKCAKGEPNLGRPDGLLVLETWGRRWTALVEAKIGKTEIGQEQVERYLELAKQNKLDAVITISNQFSAVPQHHPLKIKLNKYKGVQLFHFSWMHILTEADLLTVNQDVEDDDQAYMLSEFLRFISHESAGVQGFTQMPAAWSDVVSKVQAGGMLQKTADTSAVAEAWQQETRDLCLILSRQLRRQVSQRLGRAAAADAEVRFQGDLDGLCTEQALSVTFDIPNTAAPLNVRADLRGRSVLVSMKLRAPDDKVSSRARLNWLLRQIPESAQGNLHIRCQWPKTSVPTQFKLQELREDPTKIDEGKGKLQVTGFEVILVADLGRRFEQRRSFIEELERAVPEFYEVVGQHLRAWQPPAPRITEERSQPQDVTPAAISETAEASSMQE
ncbi:MAG: hypothetical protein ACK4SZ_02080 [Allosphingosinicella sp.]|uniref:hypothetical protein n=1 Tax=Allosphingosinicella sp. TaxID=2823234 RepID=UPI0039635305